jgi:hypothetical protein
MNNNKLILDINTEDRSNSSWDMTSSFAVKSVVVAPVIFCAKLNNGKYYYAITRSMNETLAKWKAGFAPLWVRKYHDFCDELEIVEIHPCGNARILKNMVLAKIKECGAENVRSSLPGHYSIILKDTSKIFTLDINGEETVQHPIMVVQLLLNTRPI